MNHLKLVRPITAVARPIPGVSFLFDPAQIAFELPSDAPQRPSDASPVAKPKRNTKLKGDISEVMVLAALVRAGYNVSIPFGENQRYDLIADNGKQLLRIQVKSGRIRGGVIIYSCCSSHGHRKTTLWYKPYFGQIDFLAIYCADNGKVYLLPEAELKRTHCHLRLTPPKNNMVKTIRWASKYELA
ncbi:MAG TPA: group I intron-associated PD-(D/E)XK endonuclease [Candidatus Elarobacter sp.]|nr:group I intron-associated PD-(D/E)XK endonuclease [Candidatus Elarobacter sp.]